MLVRRFARSAVHRNTFFSLLAVAILGTFAFQIQTASAASTNVPKPKDNLSAKCAGEDGAKATKPNTAAFEAFSLNINGAPASAAERTYNFSKAVKSGDTVQITFQLKDGKDKNGNKSSTEPDCLNTKVSITSFTAPENKFNAKKLSDYEQVDHQTVTPKDNKKYTLRVQVPECNHHIVVSTGSAYSPDKLSSMEKSGRIVMKANGGVKDCDKSATTGMKGTVKEEKVCPESSGSSTSSNSASNASGYKLTIKNTQEARDIFTVKQKNATGESPKDKKFTIQPGKSHVVNVPLKSGETTTVTVTSSAGKFKWEKRLTLNCSAGSTGNGTAKPKKTEIDYSLQFICPAGSSTSTQSVSTDVVRQGVRVILKNKSKTASETFRVTYNGADAPDSPITVAANGEAMTNFAAYEDQTVTVVVTGEKSNYSQPRSVVVDCDRNTDNSGNSNSGNGNGSGNDSGNSTGNGNGSGNNSGNNTGTNGNGVSNNPSSGNNGNTTYTREHVLPKMVAECDAANGAAGKYILTLPNRTNTAQTFAVLHNNNAVSNPSGNGSNFVVPAGKQTLITVTMQEDEVALVTVAGKPLEVSEIFRVTMDCADGQSGNGGNNAGNNSGNNGGNDNTGSGPSVCICQDDTSNTGTVGNGNKVTTVSNRSVICEDDKKAEPTETKPVNDSKPVSKSPTVKPAAIVKPAANTPETKPAEDSTIVEADEVKTSTPSELAYTGIDVKAVGLLALCLLIIGFGFVDIARRARA